METETEICPLCARPLGRRRERHHLVPRLKGGRETVTIHPICHRKIHALFSEAELARSYASIATLRAHPEIARFTDWLAGKPADFHAATRTARTRRR
jgi:hypothetical protein